MTDPQSTGFTLPGWLITIFHIIITGALPLLLVLLNARLLMTPVYMRWEYNRSSFPADQFSFPSDFSFTPQDRIDYGSSALAYLFNSEDISYLGDQTFPDGSPFYNERELSHMEDVKDVTSGLSTFGYTLIAIWLASVLVMAISANGNPALYQALLQGSILTVALIITGLIAVATSFNWLFTQFHAMFFEGDTWLFLYSDTLIRLFPERFWIDAFALMFGGALLEALILGGAMWRTLRR